MMNIIKYWENDKNVFFLLGDRVRRLGHFMDASNHNQKRVPLNR